MPLRVVAAVVTLLALAAGLAQVGWFVTGGAAPERAAQGYIARQIGYGLFVLAAAGLGALVLAIGASRIADPVENSGKE